MFRRVLPVVAVVLLSNTAFAQAVAPVEPAAPAGSTAAPAADSTQTESAAAEVGASDGAKVAAVEVLPTSASPAAADSAKASDVASLALPQKAEETTPKRLAVSKEGFFQPGVNIQAWFWTTHLDASTTSSFRIRRAELSAKGDLVPGTIAYKVMIDPAKTLRFGKAPAPVIDDESGSSLAPAAHVDGLVAPSDTSILQDASITWITEYTDVSIGQFKNPLSLEGSGSASKLLFPERSIVSRAFGDRRDLGLKLDKRFDFGSYYFGIFNGAGLNVADGNNQKDVALRLEATPVKGLMLGVVGYTSVGQRSLASTRDRVEADLKIDLANVVLQAEVIQAWDGPKGSRVVSNGGYVAAGYTLFDKLQPLVRLGRLNPDKDATKDETNAYELGLNYYVLEHDLKLQSSYSLFDPEASGAKTRSEFILSSQLAF